MVRRRLHGYLHLAEHAHRRETKTISGHPERIQEVNKEIEAMGAKVVDQYAVLGVYDFTSVVEAADRRHPSWR